MDLAPSPLAAIEPPRDCPRCPRLVALRERLRVEQPDWWNAPVPALGDAAAWLVIVGLAPGRAGANRTGRAFTGDAAGALLFATLTRLGLASADPGGAAPTLEGALIFNAVRCLPPENKPTPEEARACRPFLAAAAAALPAARVYVALGQLAHQSTIKALGGRLPKARFAHGAEHRLPDGRVVLDSYHCSRYNQQTGRLTPTMLEAVFARALSLRGG
ncbi:uracil-DNA glycosylase [Sphingomonas yunnanensis]|uniref:uracil-DNA glycosylase n=1 Tax=Sphingomonas yunnanensis TaxID=310400 RepID=UPI001CA6F992|nr:uracil-DNA glycosylase [Sphingomonas yunnanensis]MBY9064269.1 uracil-DNA glycosylase [Sphingomonas yunnanensis]